MVMLDNTRQKTNPQNRTGTAADVSLSLKKVQIRRAHEVGFYQWHGLLTQASRGSKSP